LDPFCWSGDGLGPSAAGLEFGARAGVPEASSDKQFPGVTSLILHSRGREICPLGKAREPPVKWGCGINLVETGGLFSPSGGNTNFVAEGGAVEIYTPGGEYSPGGRKAFFPGEKGGMGVLLWPGEGIHYKPRPL